MAILGSNIFRFEGLDQLSQRVRVVRVLGLERRQADYFQNRNRLGELSRRIRKPVTFIERGGSPLLVVPIDALLPTTFNLPGRTLVLEPTDETFELSFSTRDPQWDPVRLRILNYLLQNPLYNDRRLWQPQAGGAWFYATPELERNGVGLYPGAKVRAVALPGGGLGVSVDKTFRFIDTRPVSVNLSKDEFERHHRGHTHVYHYPTGWYELHPMARSDLAAGRYLIPRTGQKSVSLIEWILDVAEKPVAPELARLNPEGAVLVYLGPGGTDRAAPAELCYRVHDSKELEHTDLPTRTIVAPHERRGWAIRFVERHLASLTLGRVHLRVAAEPENLTVRACPFPDLRFGGGRTLSVRGTPGAQLCRLQDLGERRLQLLRDPAVGLAHAREFDPQYILLPRTVADSFGPAFVADLKRAVGQFTKAKYEPTVVVYNDAVSRAFLQQAQAILSAAIANCRDPGFALTMVHDYAHRKRREEDALAAYAQQELLAQLQVATGICHVESAREFYEQTRGNAKAPRQYELRRDVRGKALGYLRNVALNHVILTNQQWPFELASPLHADVVIGLDVKAHSCCLIAFADRGARLYSELHTSEQREKLKARQVKTYLGALLRKISSDSATLPRRIVLHRDGEVFADEVNGAQEAIAQLIRESKLAADAELTVLAIPKSSAAPVRLFDIDLQGDRLWVNNPTIGNTFMVGNDEAYVCTTGEPFRRKGTARPLHIIRATGPMDIAELADDVFALACLSWMRPEDCMRDPITVRLADRYLTESAGSYDQEDVAFEASDADGSAPSQADAVPGPTTGRT